MMPQLWHTPIGNCSCLWTASPRPAKTSGWSSVWRRQMSWANTYWHHQSSPLMTMKSKSFTNSCTLGPPSSITSPLTLRLTRGSGRQPQHSFTWHQECGQTPSWPWRWRWLCTMPASSAPCSMAARHGPCMPVRRKGSTLSTLEAYDAYSASHGKIRWPTLTSCLTLASPPCTPCWDKLAALAWPCLPYGGWLNSKRCPLWRAYLRTEKHWPPTAELQGCVQERHKGAWHQHQFLGGPCCRLHQLEKYASQTAADQQKGSWQQWQAEKQACKKETAANRPESMHRCDLCNWDCHSHIGLYSHRRCCSS